MTRLLILVCVLFSAASADAAVSRVQIKQGTGGPLTASVTFTSATVSGHSIVIAFNAFQASGGSTYSCSDGTNTWATDVQKESSDGGNVGICSAHNITGVGSHTVTVTASQSQFGINMVAIEYAGTATSMTLDGTPTSTQSTGTSPNPGNVVTANAGVVVGIVYYLNQPSTSAEDAGWTLVSKDDVSYSVIEKITSGAGSYNPFWTISNSGSYATAGSAYKAAAGGVAPTRHLLTLGVGH